MKTFITFCLLFAVFGFASSESGCPETSEVLPCVCRNKESPKLWCYNIDDAESLKTVFVNSARYSYDEVHIENSTLQFLPSTLFESVHIRDLYLKNVTLLALFDTLPTTLVGLRKLHLERIVVLRGLLWKFMKPLKSLKVLVVYYITVKTLGKDFSDHVPKDIEEITFSRTSTKFIQPGIFEGFTKIDKFEVSSGKIEKLTRDILPVPFNGRILYFNDNKLNKISGDMFSQMPNLQSLGLNGNNIATFPESAFQATGDKFEYLFLEDNPIKCDCKMLWLIRRKRNIPVLTGKCENPKRLHGRELKDLTTGDIHC